MTTLGVLGRIDLEEEIARFPPDGPSGRRSETLLKTPSLRVVLVTMRAGTELADHTAPGPITVQPLQGRFVLVVEGEGQEITPGMLMALAESTRHAVRAVETGAFLPPGWPPQMLRLLRPGRHPERDRRQVNDGSSGHPGSR